MKFARIRKPKSIWQRIFWDDSEATVRRIVGGSFGECKTMRCDAAFASTRSISLCGRVFGIDAQ